MPRIERYDAQGRRTIFDDRSLAEAVDEAMARLHQEYQNQIAVGITHAGRPLQIDEAAQMRMAAVVTQINAGVPLPAGFAWRMADNTDMAVTAPQMIAIAAAASARVYALRRALWKAVDQVRAAKTREEADAVRAVWPAP